MRRNAGAEGRLASPPLPREPFIWHVPSVSEQPPKPFAVLYRWSVEPEHEESFLKRWHAGTRCYRESHGSIGSCLCRAANGDFIAFARWPSEAAREQAFAAVGAFEPWPGIREFEETRLSVEDDQLTLP